MATRVGPVPEVGGAEEFAVWQEFDAGVAGVAFPARVFKPLFAGVAVKQLGPALAGAGMAQVAVRADPGDVVSVGRGLGHPVAEGDEIAAVR